MTNLLLSRGVARLAVWMATVALVLPPLPGRACACAVKTEVRASCSCRGHRAESATSQRAGGCCEKHRNQHQRPCCQRLASMIQTIAKRDGTSNPSCHCSHGQLPETPVAPVSQSQMTVDQLLLAQAGVRLPWSSAVLPDRAATFLSQDHCLGADTSLERCILLSRLTL